MADYEKIYKSDSVWKSIFTLTVPALITILVMIFYNMADMFFIGQLGNTSMVASVSIISPVFSLIMALASMIGFGGCTVIANAFGAGDIEKARSTSSLCFYAAIFIGILVTIVVFAVRNPLLTLLGVTEDMWTYAKQYMEILALGAPLMMLSSALGTIVRSEGAVRQSLVGNLSGTITNIVLDPVFIFLFKMGVAGAAIATVIGNFVACCCYFFFITKKAKILSIDPRLALRQPAAIFGIIALGVPNAVSTILSGFAGTFSNRLLSGYGSDAIAAMAAAGKPAFLITMLQMGVCMGVQPLMAYTYGAKNKPRMKEILKKLAILTISVSLFSTLICFLFSAQLVGLFLKDPAVTSLSVSLVPYLIFGAPFHGPYYLSTNFLQASKNAPAAITLSVLRQGALLIPLLYIMHTLFGFVGIAASHIVADIASMAIALLVFVQAYRKFLNA